LPSIQQMQWTYFLWNQCVTTNYKNIIHIFQTIPRWWIGVTFRMMVKVFEIQTHRAPQSVPHVAFCRFGKMSSGFIAAAKDYNFPVVLQICCRSWTIPPSLICSFCIVELVLVLDIAEILLNGRWTTINQSKSIPFLRRHFF
jgi:hypothetical protein